MTDAPKNTPNLPPLVDWMSRHGLKLLGLLILLELGFHAFAVHRSRTREAQERAPSTSVTPPGDSGAVTG